MTNCTLAADTTLPHDELDPRFLIVIPVAIFQFVLDVIRFWTRSEVIWITLHGEISMTDFSKATSKTRCHQPQGAATYQENVRNYTYRCPTCEISFGSAGNLARYLGTADHLAKEDGTYVPPKSQDGDLSWWCDLCDIGWADEYGLILHERRSYGHRVKQAERQGLPPPPKPERG